MSRLWTTHGRTDGRTECEDRARILETEFAIQVLNCQNCNQCLKCHKSPKLSLFGENYEEKVMQKKAFG